MDERTKQILRDAWLVGYTVNELISMMDMASRKTGNKGLSLSGKETIKFYMEGMDQRFNLALSKNPFPSI